jgi:peptide/nickel transport system substrate-binding protein
MLCTSRHGVRALRSGTSITAVAILLAACTSGADSTATSHTASDKEIASFTYAISALPSSLNGMTTEVRTAQISALVTEPLEHYAYKDGTTQFTPGLAESVRESGDRAAVFTLRDGVKFSDGSALTADDVAWSITAAAAPTAQTAGNMAGFASAKATGANEVMVTWAYPTTSIRKRIDGTVEVQQAKFAQAHPTDLGTAGALPVGTGPYVYQSETAQDITLTRNPAYWGTQPKVKKLVFTKIAQDSSAQLAMRSGSVQGGTVGDLNTVSAWQAISGASLDDSHDPYISFLSLDLKTKPFDDVHVRRAVAYSIDRQGLVKSAFAGHADVLTSLFPIESYSDVIPSLSAAQQFAGQLPTYGFDLAAAKRELAQSAYPQGFTTTITYSSGTAWVKVLLLSLQQNLKSLGITVDLKPLATQAWLQSFFGHQATGIQVFPGVAVLSSDPSTLIPAFVGTASMRPNMLNSANFTTPQVESGYPMLALQTAGKYTKDERWKAVQTALSQVADQVPYVPLISQPTYYALAAGYLYTQTPATADLLGGTWIDYLRATS